MWVGRGPPAHSTSVEKVFTCAVFVPSAPLLVPELAGPYADDTAAVRAASVTEARALAALATDWVVIGPADAAMAASGPADTPRCSVVDQSATGSFARFGVDVAVTLDSERALPSGPQAPLDPQARLPLSMLIGAWLREQAGARRATGVVIDPMASAEECAHIGARIDAALAQRDHPVGVLVVGDGATALSAKAPGGGVRESAMMLQNRIDKALGGPDLQAIADLGPAECADEGVCGRVAWQAAAAMVADIGVHAETRYADAPFGVGYLVARWMA